MKNFIKCFLLANLVAFSLNAFADDSDILPQSKLSKSEMQKKLPTNQCFTTEELSLKHIYICKEKDNSIQEVVTSDISKDPRLLQAEKAMLKGAGVFLH